MDRKTIEQACTTLNAILLQLHELKRDQGIVVDTKQIVNDWRFYRVDTVSQGLQPLFEQIDALVADLLPEFSVAFLEMRQDYF